MPRTIRFRRNAPRFQGAKFDANVAAAETVSALATRKGLTPAQVALAWLLHKGEDIAPIPGTKRRSTLEENLAAAAIHLDAAELAELDERAFPPEQVSGTRYPEHMMHMISR